MKTKLLIISALAMLSTLCLQPPTVFAQGTAFTYQGRLNQGGNPAQGIYDLRFAIYDAASGPAQVGNALTNAATEVTNGLFTVTLDFGGGVFTGNPRWLDVSVRTNGGGAFTTLAPRQALTPTPYAMYSASAFNASTANAASFASSSPAAGLVGTLNPSQLPAAVITNNSAGVTLAGTFTGSGSGLTSVNADQVDGQHGAFYQNAANLTSGTFADARLSANVPLLNTNQVFAGSNRFAGVVAMTNAANTIVGAFTGNGAALTNLSGAAIASGTVSMSRLPTGLVTNNATGINLTGSFSGNGAGVTNVNLVTVNNQGAIGWATNWGNFVLASSPNVGATPYSVAAADVNSDGKLDLISANSYDHTVSVMTNNGSGGFVASATITVGRSPVWVTAADVGGNNKVDLVTANSDTNTLTVLTNNGSGQFVLAATLTVGANPYAVVAADVNSDGKLDLISANQGDSSLSVLTNGNSGFMTSATLPVDPGPRAVAVADVNADGKVDLISANTGFNTLTVLTNNGSGGFVLASSPPAGIFPIAVAAADLNGDGKTDLVAANSAADTLTVLTNNGSGGFVAAPTLTVSGQPYYVAATDVTGDGRADLVSANFGANTLTLLTNNGIGGFTAAATLTVGNNPHSVAVADVSGDGKVDLISANAGPSTLSILFNGPASYGANFTGNGASLTSLNAASLTGTASSLSASNINVLGTITGNGGSLTNLNASQLTSGTVPLTQLPGAVVTNNATAVTLTGTLSGNGAGLTNLNASQLMAGTVPLPLLPTAVVTNNATGVSLNGTFTGNGAGLTNIPFSALPAVPLTNNQSGVVFKGLTTVSNLSVAATNFVNFLVVSNPPALNGSAITNLNASQLIAGTLPLAQLPSVVITNNSTAVNLTGTFAGNGAGVTNVDLITVNDRGAIGWATNWGAFSLASSPTVGLSPESVVAADVNGDGKPDLISANYNAATLSVVTNNGSGGFATAATVSVGSGPIAVTAADVNGDSKLDLISANRLDNTLSVRTNSGSGAFVAAATLSVGINPYSVTAADVNGDGAVDLISANRDANTLSVLTNSSGSFVLASSPTVGTAPRSVAVADVNGDGKVDLISGNSAANTLTVLTNNGSGGFVLASSPAVGGDPGSVAAADVNGDGKVDLISANSLTDTLSVVTNNGSGGFVLASSPVVGNGPQAVTAADVNGDGKVDLISANEYANTLTVLTNNGTGGFVLASSPSVGSHPVSITAADVNGDGGLDLISANLGNNNLSVLFNTPNFSASFQGSGSALTGLNAAQLATGTVPLARLPGAVITNNATAVTLAGTFSGNGAALTNVNADQLDGQHGAYYQNAVNLTSGTLADARLSGNVALRNANQSFTGTNLFSQPVGIATASPGQLLQVGDANTGSSQGMIRLGSRSSVGGNNRSWDIGVPQTGTDASGIGYSFVIDDTQLGTTPEFIIRWGTGYVGIGRTNPATVLDVNGTVTATNFAGNALGLTNQVPSANYVFSYSTITQAVVTAGTFQDITLSTDAQISGWTHAASAASFTNAQSGLYLVQYDAEVTTTTTASSTVSLRAVLNGVEIAGSQSSANANTANLVVPLSKSFIASISSGGILKFQLTGSSVNDRLISNTGTGTTRPSFSCTIMRLQ